MHDNSAGDADWRTGEVRKCAHCGHGIVYESVGVGLGYRWVHTASYIPQCRTTIAVPASHANAEGTS